MADRFERLFKLPNNLYSAGFPILISAGALLKDTQSGSIIVQLKFQSVSSLSIKALKVKLSSYDITGKEIEGIVEYQYLDLCISNGQSFGSNKAIVLPNNVTRSFKISGMDAVFANGTSQTATMPLSELPNLIPLGSSLKDPELIKQYRLTVNDEANYAPRILNELWGCSCGVWNNARVCANCGASQENTMSAYDLTALNDAKVIRVEQERLIQISERKKIEEITKKRKKLIGIAVSIVVPVIVITALLVYCTHIGRVAKLRAAPEVVSAGYSHSLGLKKDGTVTATGSNDYQQCDVSSWENIVSVSAGHDFSIGLKSDGTVVATGYNGTNQCDVIFWNDIVAVSAGYHHSVGLKSDGTVVATGPNWEGECNVSQWNDIVAICSGNGHTVGLKSDGTVIAVGDNSFGQCNVADWENIVSISTSYYTTVGLKSDGTVVATGYNNFNQCDVSSWHDIIAIAAGENTTVGIRSDGSVVISSDVSVNGIGIEELTLHHDIVALSVGYGHVLALSEDGVLLSVGYNKDGCCNTLDWDDIRLPSK